MVWILGDGENDDTSGKYGYQGRFDFMGRLNRELDVCFLYLVNIFLGFSGIVSVQKRVNIPGPNHYL